MKHETFIVRKLQAIDQSKTISLGTVIVLHMLYTARSPNQSSSFLLFRISHLYNFFFTFWRENTEYIGC